MADLDGDDMCRCGAICTCGGDDWGEEYYDDDIRQHASWCDRPSCDGQCLDEPGQR